MKNRITLADYKKGLVNPPIKATLCFLIKDNRILLAMKKRGFAEGKWNGVGGKVDDGDESTKTAAIRETQEEIDVTPISPTLKAKLDFYHINNQDANQQVFVYISNKWIGIPKETEEMAPKWFDFDKIPYKDMWEDDQVWLPQILNGKFVKAEFLFDANEKIIEQKIKT